MYIAEYESGGQYWPMIHNTVIISLVIMQIIALGVFGLRKSPIASGFTIPLLIFTILFNEYCRQQFHPLFKNQVAEVVIENELYLRACTCMFMYVVFETMPLYLQNLMRGLFADSY